jgi:hypothetical protein
LILLQITGPRHHAKEREFSFGAVLADRPRFDDFEGKVFGAFDDDALVRYRPVPSVERGNASRVLVHLHLSMAGWWVCAGKGVAWFGGGEAEDEKECVGLKWAAQAVERQHHTPRI